MTEFYSRLLDLLIFAIQLALIAAFLLVLKRSLGIELRLGDFFREVRKLLILEVSPEALNALALVFLGLFSLLMIGAMIVGGWRDMAYFLLGANRDSTPWLPVFTVFGMLSALWIVAMVLCFQFCAGRRD